MKKRLKKIPGLKTENGLLVGGFASLDVSQMNKIRGGKQAPESNVVCDNKGNCNGDNGACTNASC
ncbi:MULTISPECIES: hypothetical protein [Flavobacterium]|uniref:Bacteriocin n=1 Tax=Flavobacterium ginsengisoli TaxID=871694 RepID=A0ABP7EU73_9FLAO|nr:MULTISPECIES: hypothetical protein [Flavobacterium]MBJ2123400.1 hypothetical protein [Flavobacterium sp. IB48]